MGYRFKECGTCSFVRRNVGEARVSRGKLLTLRGPESRREWPFERRMEVYGQESKLKRDGVFVRQSLFAAQFEEAGYCATSSGS